MTSRVQRSPNPPELAQPRLSRSNGGHAQREGENLGVFVPICLVLPRWEATNLGVFDLRYFALPKRGCANSVVGLELAEEFPEMTGEVVVIALLRAPILATPLAWYKCLNSQNAQKCLREGAKGVFGPLERETPKIVSCTARDPVLGCFPQCETRFARCERLFWDSQPERPQITFSTLP